MRGSTSRASALPFTLIFTLTVMLFTFAIAAVLSGIQMGPFDLFSASAARGNQNGALHQSHNELALVFGRSAHVRLRIGSSTSGFGGGGNRFVVQTFSTKCRLRFRRADRR